MKRHLGTSLVYWAALTAAPAIAQVHSTYVQTNLVSNQSGVASHTDPNLVNAWGIAFGGTTGPWWVNTNGTGLSELFDGTGAPFPPTGQLIVSIPPPSGSSGPSTPTGIVFSGTTDFQSRCFCLPPKMERFRAGLRALPPSSKSLPPMLFTKV